jgi:hypothetical protein
MQFSVGLCPISVIVEVDILTAGQFEISKRLTHCLILLRIQYAESQMTDLREKNNVTATVGGGCVQEFRSYYSARLFHS